MSEYARRLHADYRDSVAGQSLNSTKSLIVVPKVWVHDCSSPSRRSREHIELQTFRDEAPLGEEPFAGGYPMERIFSDAPGWLATTFDVPEAPASRKPGLLAPLQDRRRWTTPH